MPKGVDYDMWTGPAPKQPFNQNRFHSPWHWLWDYGTGDIGNDGVHQLDIARWALGVDYPTEVTGMGRKLFFDDDQQTPDTMGITFNYPDKVMMFEMKDMESLWDGRNRGTALPSTVPRGWSISGAASRCSTRRGKLVLDRKKICSILTPETSSIASATGRRPPPKSRSGMSRRCTLIWGISWPGPDGP